MSYNDLSESTLTPEERLLEAGQIIDMLDSDDLSKKENDLVYNISTYGSCSIKQLFWLRDIRDKYC
jgi:hypothetical protein